MLVGLSRVLPKHRFLIFTRKDRRNKRLVANAAGEVSDPVLVDDPVELDDSWP